MAKSIELRIVAFQKDGAWVAQCLEYDIAAHAGDLDTVILRIDDTLQAEAEYTSQRFGAPFQGINPAPELYRTLWDRALTSVCAPEILHAAEASKHHYKVAA
jgi:hypothetical protein